MPHSSRLLTQVLVAWDSGIICLLTLAWSVIVTAHPRQIKQRAQTQDSNRLFIAFFVVSAAVASLFAVVFVLGTSKNLPPDLLGLHIALSGVSVVGSWLMVHTVFTLRYAHYYYAPKHLQRSHQAAPTNLQESHAGGLDFPGDKLPDYWDFAYFSLVLGMTFQVSDVQITSRLMRRLALLHGLLSFAFNTIIVALSINIISSLI
jgi:uncharacterized membrane protein